MIKFNKDILKVGIIVIDLEYAKEAFEQFCQNYNMTEEKLLLKKRHTYQTMACVDEIAANEKLSEEDHQLALLIALLHDVGRFIQFEKIHTFDDQQVSHALLSIEYLFEQEHLSDFILTRQYDQIIRLAILYHSDYKLSNTLTNIEQLHCKLIRDADKLDNFRVKNTETIHTLLDINESELGNTFLSDYIYDQVMNCQLIKSSERKTKMDFWVSWIAFIFDLNFKSSYCYLVKTQIVSQVIDRVEYTLPNTYKKMKLIKKHCENYIYQKSL